MKNIGPTFFKFKSVSYVSEIPPLLNISFTCLSSELVKMIQGRIAKISVTQP